LLVNAESRASLMVGIIGTALKEHVFSALWFGGTEKQIEELENQQEQLRDPEDERLFLSSSSLIFKAYERTLSRAEICNRFTIENPKDKTDSRERAEQSLAKSLEKMLTPLYCMG
jgi:hypothetical protein